MPSSRFAGPHLEAPLVRLSSAKLAFCLPVDYLQLIFHAADLILRAGRLKTHDSQC